MTALEEIQQAIQRLTELRDAGSAGTDEWKVWRASTGIRSSDDYEWIFFDYGDERNRYRIAEKQNWGTSADMQMIVTLHRTIDAQIAILRREHEFARVNGWPPQPFPERLDVLALARAINGSAS